jgi:predicted RNA-binding Zn ribbon-like protein
MDPAERRPGLALAAAQASGFPVGGEPLAVDLADTLVTVTSPPTDLLSSDERNATFWALQAARLPAGAAAPGISATHAIRAAVRELLDAHLEQRSPAPDALETVNRAAADAPTSPHLTVSADGQLTAGIIWTNHDPQARTLAAVAGSAIEVLTGPAAGRLRRCANPACSMLFVAADTRRKFCTQNICGNRTRVARHYRRHRADA